MESIIVSFLYVVVAIVCVGFGIMLIRWAIDDKSILLGICGVAMLLVIVIPTTIFAYDYYQTSNCTLIETDVTAEVINKEYKKAWTQIISTGKVTSVVVHPEQYNLEIKNDNISSVIDNKQFYEALKIGDKIIVVRSTWKYKNGEIYKEVLKFK